MDLCYAGADRPPPHLMDRPSAMKARVTVTLKNGVLTVTIPNSATAKDTAKRIAINAGSDTKH